MPLHDILHWVVMNQLSCVVSVTLENSNEKTFYLDQGNLVFATSLKDGQHLGRYLLTSGVSNEDQLSRAVAESTQKNISVTRYLAEYSRISTDILADATTNLAIQLIVEDFADKNGSVSITSPLPDAILNGPFHLDTVRIIGEAVRIHDELTKDDQQRDKDVDAISQRLYHEEFELPVLPAMVTQLLSLVEDETTSFHDLAKVIMTDQVLTSRILRIANSPLFASSGQIDSFQQAIVRIGMNEIVNIVLGLHIHSLQGIEVSQEQLQEILDNALLTSFVSSGLARACRLDPDQAFLGGLLLDLGKTVILSVAKDFKIEQALLYELLTNRHAEIGALIAKKWNYPKSIQNLIRYHHSRHLGGVVHKMITLVQIADHLVQFGSAKDVAPELLHALDLSQEAIEEVYSMAVTTFHQIKNYSSDIR